MELFLLADVDYEDFLVVGIYTTLRQAKHTAASRGLLGSVFWIQKHTTDQVSPGDPPHMTSKDGKTWNETHWTE